MSTDRETLLLFSEVAANGGIQRFNRTLVAACDQLALRCRALSLADGQEAVRAAALPAWIHGYSSARFRFAIAVAAAILGGRYRTIVVGHIHLLPLVASLVLPRVWRGTRLIVIAHGTEIWRGIDGPSRAALRLASNVLCVSSYTRRCVADQVPQLAPARLVVFPNALGHRWSAEQPGACAMHDQSERFVLSVARLTRHDRTKGIVHVIEAMAHLPQDLHYVIVGDGDDRPELESLAQRVGVGSRVHFRGAVSDDDLRALYAACAAFVLPSSQEGFGIVFLEAMYFGAVVIAARERGAVDVVRHEATGLLVAYGDVAGIAAAIDRLLRDQALGKRLREMARKTVTEGGPYTFRAFVARTAEQLGLRAADSMRRVALAHCGLEDEEPVAEGGDAQEDKWPSPS